MAGSPGRDEPLVSCIMPTRNRRAFVGRAIEYFLRQTYDNTELVILDDGTDPVSDLVPDERSIRYEWLGRRITLGEKRNVACEAARGEIIMHWDDDDWMAARRVTCQVSPILDGRADMTGLDALFFLDSALRSAWLYKYRDKGRPWLAGGTLAYSRDCWKRNPFPHVDVGEDTRFVFRRGAGRMHALADTGLYIATVHAGNTCPKRTDGHSWQVVPLDRIKAVMGPDWPVSTDGEPRAHTRPRVPMATPCITLVLPVHAAAAPLLERTLVALEAQDCPAGSFEVVVAADGGDPDGAIRRIAEQARGYPCRVVHSPRTRGDLPHRNHARNAGCDAARAPRIWVMDADFILPPHAISHALAEADSADGGGAAVVLSPCLASIPTPPDRWVRETARAVNERDATALLGIAHAAAPADDQYSGFASAYRSGSPRSDAWPRMLEGFPLLPAALWRALDGFNEEFIGWGGNKEEFVRRLLALQRQGVVQVRLLRSVLALHQPHAPDPDRRGGGTMRRQNQQRFRRMLTEIEGNAEWWQGQAQRARHAASGSRSRPVRVGLLTVADPRKGLFRDAESLAWALAGPPVRPAHGATFEVSAYPTRRLREDLERNPERAISHAAPAGGADTALRGAAVPPGTRFADWVRRLDVLIASEVWLGRAFDTARKAGARVVFIPNLEWACIREDTDAWLREVQRSGVEVWGKTAHAVQVLSDHGVRAVPVCWSVPDPVRMERSASAAGPLRLLMVAGMGGWRRRRGVDIALSAFAIARDREASLRLTIQSIRPLAEVAGGAPVHTPGLRVVEGFRTREELAALHDDADVVLYPSRFEGFGLSMLEALHAGLPVIATDGEPMRELVEHGHNGLLAHADPAGKVRLASAWECSPAGLADCMVRLARDPDLRRRLTCPEPAALLARQHQFRMRVRQHAGMEPAPRAIIVHDRRPTGARRAELFWADALQDHGYEAVRLGLDEDEARRQAALAVPHDMILVSKAPPELLRTLRRETPAPLVMWHHDLSDASPARMRWFREAAALCDLVAVPHPVKDDVAPAAALLHLFPGPKTHADRGPGRRPSYRGPPGTGRDVVFLGRPTPDRVATVTALLRAGIVVRVFGDSAAWRAAGVSCAGPRFGADADAAIASAGLVLATSARNDIHYTSNRLFHAAGAGGCLLVRSFPGLEQLYPANALVAWDDVDDVPRIAAGLLRDDQQQRAMRAAAEEATFRQHSWHHRVSVLLGALLSLPDRNAVVPPPPPTQPVAVPAVRRAAAHRRRRPAPAPSPTRAVVPAATYRPVAFWEQRALSLGQRSVGHHAWSDAEFDRESDRCWTLLRQLLHRYRSPDDHRVLDFGCGTGRFAHRLAADDLHVVGVDIAPAMLRIAGQCPHPRIQLACVPAYGALPFGDGAFDVLWLACTLQHVPDPRLAGTIAELRRVLRPGGLVIAMENTLAHHRRASTSGHIVFRRTAEYLAALPGLAMAGTIRVAGEPHSLMAGRLPL